MLTVEFSLGRAGQQSPVRLYQKLTPEKKIWNIHGYLAMVGNYILMMFYNCVTGWILQYFVKMVTGEFSGADSAEVSAIFADMLKKPAPMIGFTFFVILLGFAVNSMGVQNGLERVTKVMMLALLAVMAVLAVNSIFLEGGQEGLRFYLVPNVEKMREIGIGSMAIFGSYIDKERSLLGEAANVALLDTAVAFVSGLIIFPTCMAFGVNVNAGPPLIFETLPNVFIHLPLGRLWGSLFFIFLSFAALSTVLAVFENIISCTMDVTGWSRKKACIVNGIAMMVLVLPCILGFNLWSGFHPLGGESTVLNLEDFLVSNVLLPAGCMIYVFYATTRYGWGWEMFEAEANAGRGWKVKQWMRPYFTYILPVMILILCVYSLLQVLG